MYGVDAEYKNRLLAHTIHTTMECYSADYCSMESQSTDTLLLSRRLVGSSPGSRASESSEFQSPKLGVSLFYPDDLTVCLCCATPHNATLTPRWEFPLVPLRHGFLLCIVRLSSVPHPWPGATLGLGLVMATLVLCVPCVYVCASVANATRMAESVCTLPL